MRLRRAGQKFRAKYKIVGGGNFYGQLLDIPDTSRVSNFFSVRRYLRVLPNSGIVAGMLVEVDDDTYIVAKHASGYYKNQIYTHFKMFSVDEERVWTSKTTSINAVTGLHEKDVLVNNGTIQLSVQPKGDIEDSISIQVPQHTVITNTAVSVDDMLGDNWVVTGVDKQLGIYVVTVKEG